MKKINNIWLIHIFALIHAIVSLVSGLVGIGDAVMLTLLTMLLVVLVCLRRKMGVMFMLICVIAANIVGFAIGEGLAVLFDFFPISPMIIHPVSTFICTELLGWLTELACQKYKVGHPDTTPPDSKSLRILLAAFVVIIFFRLLIIVFTRESYETNFLLEIIVDYIFSTVSIVFVAEFAIRSREEAEKAAEEAELAKYRYISLKQQVNPHFLFNTLNVLDYMILEKSPEEASRYTHKLAEVYRYMILNEEKKTVTLQEELDFVGEYVGLLNVRFNESFRVEVNIPEEDLSHSVVPCAIQLLIENATKHNMLSTEAPLVVEVHTTKNSVVVSNNIRKRLTKSSSTGFGIKYLRQQYKDIASKSVIVKESEEQYTVILPLL